MLFLLFAACSGKTGDTDTVIAGLDDTATEDTGDTAEVIEDLGDPYLAMVAAVPPGILASDCLMQLDLYANEVPVLSLKIDPALGGEWAGADLDGGVQYVVSAYHSTCTQQTPAETIESGTFSGVAGLLFVFWFNGTNAGVQALEQTVDFAGGSVTITLAPGTPSTEIETIAASFGATVSPGAEADTWLVSFPTELPIGAVLSEMAHASGFVEGTPDWIVRPNWW